MNTTNSLWDFSLDIYAQPGVAEQCLALQDDYGVDVNLLLWSCWLERRGQILSPSLLVEAEAAVADWSQQTVQPLRSLRRRLKSHYGVENSDCEAVREAIKAAELKAEQYQQQLLQQLSPTQVSAARTTGENCRIYLASCQLSDSRTDAFVELIAVALAAAS